MRRCYSNDFFCARIRVPEASETDAFSVVVVVVVAISPGGFPTQQLRRLFLHYHARDKFTRPGKTRDSVSLWPNSSLQRSFSEGSPFSPSRRLSPKFWFLSKSLPKLGWPWTHRMFWMFFDILAMSNCFSRCFRFRFYQWIQPRDKTKRWNYSKLAYEILRITLLLFRCRKPDWHESGSRKRRAERPSWAKRRRLRPDWPRRRAAFSWTTTTRRRIFSNCNIIIYFVV